MIGTSIRLSRPSPIRKQVRFLPATARSSSTNAIKLSVYFLLLTLALGMVV
jgi:hypothetical protein